MKRTILALLAIASGLCGLLLVPSFLYNLAGLFNLQNAASGPKWETALAMVALTALAFGAFFCSYRLFRSVAAASHNDAK
jgi:hypothetical protein